MWKFSEFVESLQRFRDAVAALEMAKHGPGPVHESVREDEARAKVEVLRRFDDAARVKRRLFLFQCDGEHEAGVIAVVAESQKHAVDLLLEYSDHNIKTEMVFISDPGPEEKSRPTTWFISKTFDLADHDIEFGVVLHSFRDG